MGITAMSWHQPVFPAVRQCPGCLGSYVLSAALSVHFLSPCLRLLLCLVSRRHHVSAGEPHENPPQSWHPPKSADLLLGTGSRQQAAAPT